MLEPAIRVSDFVAMQLLDHNFSRCVGSLASRLHTLFFVPLKGQDVMVIINISAYRGGP
jgi:hypothetical protein